ncbi:hypothetical protein ACFU44_13270 [Nocardia rhizosphaerihabitans]|uniref:hypothetical protein n=1 Tax=Nocardia rhizosphaerihabitans TaxID=1691570 RepID=UPI00366E4A18
MTNNVRNERGEQRADSAPGAIAAFARFVVCGGGLGLASSVAVAQLAGVMPWAVANAVVTIASTVLGTVLHALITFGGRAQPGWREHLQSAGSAAAAYAVTSAAMFVLFAVQAAPGAVTEQIVYLSASGLAGIGRFLVLRMVVFADARTPVAVPFGVTEARTRVIARDNNRATAPVGVTNAQGSAPVTFRRATALLPATAPLSLPATWSHRHRMATAA